MTPEQLAAKWVQRTQKIQEALIAATREVTEEVYVASKAHLQRDIYDKPIDTRGSSRQYLVQRGKRKRWVFKHLLRPGEQILGRRPWRATAKQAARLRAGGTAAEEGRGRPKWTRTGHLARSESMRMEGTVGVVLNTADYALPRHDLGLEPGDPRAFFGSTRSSPPKAGGGEARQAPWRKDAIAEVEPRKLDICRKHISNALK